MKFFDYFKNIFSQDDIDDFGYDDDYIEFEEYESIDDLNKAIRERNLKSGSGSNSNFDRDEEAKLDAQLNEHISSTQMHDQFEKSKKERAVKKHERLNLSKYSKSDIQKYVTSQCDMLNEASKYIDDSKEEYSVVTSYFSDIQLIDNAPVNIKKNIAHVAQTIVTLSVDRKIYHSTENKLSSSLYGKMERIEPEMPKALVKMQNDESYFQTVKKDLRILEGERMSIRYDARDLVKLQRQIKRFSTILLFLLSIVFVIFTLATIVIQDESSYMFLTVVLLSAMLAVGLFAYLKSTERKVYVTEIRLNKATSLLNKTKIKYINSANTLDYEYSKYGVKNSYELARQYEAYLEMKREREKISKITDELNSAEEHLELLMRGMKLYDPHIWIAQVKALIDPREMNEVRHQLSLRRQKLRTQIEYNQNKVDDVKEGIKRIMVENPEYKDEILAIIENYDNQRK